MICIWIFENLVPLCITDSYYPNFFDNLLDTQFMDMDIDNYVVVTKILKNPTRRLLRNEITGQHWYPPDTALKATQPKREREREKLVLQGAHLVCGTVGDAGPEQRETKARKQERQASSRIHGRT